jgi:hypothetical protein
LRWNEGGGKEEEGRKEEGGRRKDDERKMEKGHEGDRRSTVSKLLHPRFRVSSWLNSEISSGSSNKWHPNKLKELKFRNCSNSFKFSSAKKGSGTLCRMSKESSRKVEMKLNSCQMKENPKKIKPGKRERQKNSNKAGSGKKIGIYRNAENFRYTPISGLSYL